MCPNNFMQWLSLKNSIFVHPVFCTVCVPLLDWGDSSSQIAQGQAKFLKAVGLPSKVMRVGSIIICYPLFKR